MTSPNYLKEVSKFIGLVKYHCNIWESFSHMLEPLTNLTTSKVNLE